MSFVFMYAYNLQIKGAGDKHTTTDKDDQHVDTEDEMKACMEKARKQLERDAEIFTMVMNHPEPKGCQVTKVMGLPHLPREVVKKITERNRDYDGITFLCEEDLFAGDISVSESETNLEPFRAWWGKNPPQDNKMELDLIKEIVGRYVGLLSTVVTFKTGTEMALLRTFKDSVHHTSCLNERMVLSHAQVKVLVEYGKHQRSYISGPPGAGKTLLLVLGSRTFLAESKKRHVIVVNMYRGAEGRAIGNNVYEGINAGQFFQGRVHCLPVDVNELTSKTFTEEAKTKCPGVDERDMLFVVDEIYIEDFWRCILDSFEEAFTSSIVLCAGLFSRTPKGFHEHCLDIVHRCPPSVQSLLYQVDWSEERKRAYVMDYGHRRETSTNGPTPLCVRHDKHDQGVAVSNCQHCALELFQILSEEGLVSTRGDDGGACAAPETSQDATKNFKVMILVNIPRNRYRNNGQYIETTDVEYQKYMDYISTCPFIVTLREKGLNVEMKAELGCKDLNNVTKDCLSATWVFNFQGLEAGVVIFLPGDTFGDEPSQECPLAEEETISLLSQLSTEDDSTKKGIVQFVPHTEKATGAQKSFVSRREIPAPGLKVVKVVKRTRDEEQKSQTQSATSGVSSEQGLSKPKERQDLGAARERTEEDRRPYISHSDLYWTRHDIQRFSAWDHTNIMVAGSRCLSLFILIVP
ncbi:uncharacterized protein [Littorina saxatilis]|uniref:uncharacterized protein n=1 Tax=Littorina saxatilis TaxID=31220 RepID=UPI0038B63737